MAEPSIAFTYRLVEAGWSEARLAFGDRWVELSASYLEDALGDLLSAVQSVRDGADHARASWAEEPGEFRWLFDRDGGMVEVRVLWFDDQLDHLPDDAGDERIVGRVALDELVAAIAAGAREVLERHGEQGYRERWIEHPFPVAQLQRLEGAG